MNLFGFGIAVIIFIKMLQQMNLLWHALKSDYEEKELKEAVQKTLENDDLIFIQDVVDYGMRV